MSGFIYVPKNDFYELESALLSTLMTSPILLKHREDHRMCAALTSNALLDVFYSMHTELGYEPSEIKQMAIRTIDQLIINNRNLDG